MPQHGPVISHVRQGGRSGLPAARKSLCRVVQCGRRPARVAWVVSVVQAGPAVLGAWAASVVLVGPVAQEAWVVPVVPAGQAGQAVQRVRPSVRPAVLAARSAKAARSEA